MIKVSRGLDGPPKEVSYDDGTRPNVRTCRVLALDRDGARARLSMGGATVCADIAAGALLQPVVGDEVLVVQVAERAWITQVLRRGETAAPADLSVPGATRMRLMAPELALKTSTLDVDAERMAVRAGVATLSAKVLKAVAQRLALWADLLQTQSRASVSRAEQRVTRIDGTDLLKAEQVLTEAEQLVRIEGGRHVQLRSRETVQIDGERILVS